MRQYGCLKAIPLSFFSRDLYRDVVQNWSGGVILYVLLVVTLAWGLLTVGVQKTISASYLTISNKFIPQVPELNIKEGKLSTPENRPYLIKDPDAKEKDKEVIAIIDTSGKYTSLDETDAGILVTKNAIFYKENKTVKSQEFSSDLDLQLKPDELQKKGESIVQWGWVLIFPFMVVFLFLCYIVKAAFYALLGMILASIKKVPLSYGELFKISIFALTPALVISTIFDWFLISFNHQWILFFVLTLGYITFGIDALKNIMKGKQI